MKTAIWKTIALGFILFAANSFAQLTPPGGGGGGGGGGGITSAFFPPNTNFLIAVQETNIVLNWRSSTNKIFLLEHRATLSGAAQWGELTNYFRSAANTNWTRFVHANIVRSQPTDFYRLFDVTPVARDDFFAIDQDSADNQLNIFQNDSCPNGDLFYVTNLVSASHGGISYSLDASTFQYTPDSGFYGVDSFGYSITSNHGDVSSNATVSVFVNQSGNSSPSAPDISITLPTNTYTATFNALTNATDPDGDTNILFAVSSPSLGSVSNNASGDITYVRNPNLFGGDAFTYTVTDGKGGYGICHVKISQVDTDNDGMPDEWETRNGLDPVTDDSTADPDGDGLPNLAEFELGTNPHIADNPLNFPSVTNGMPVSGFAQLPLHGLNPTRQISPVVLYVNGNPASDSSLLQSADGQWFFIWDTTHLTNGSYQLKIGFSFNEPGSPDEIQTVFGGEQTVVVANMMTFARLTSKFTDALFIDATLTVTNASYDVYLYDVSGAPLVYATGLTTTSGQIHLPWNLKDGSGNQISFDSIRAEFYIAPQAQAQVVRPMTATPSVFTSQWFTKQLHIGTGSFAIAYGYDYYWNPDKYYREQMMINGVINIFGNPADPWSYHLLPSANWPYTSAFRYDSEDDKKTLFTALASGGFFFWTGHGNNMLIDGNIDHSYITASEVGTNLNNNQSFWSSGKHQWTPVPDQHPYKLVILNACETYSEEWAKAFGFDFDPAGSSISTADCGSVGRNMQAFVGWPVKIKGPSPYDVTGVTQSEYGASLAVLSELWMEGYPLNQCLYNFGLRANSSLYVGFPGQDQWKISGCYDLRRGD